MARPQLTIRTRIEAEDAATPNVRKAQTAFESFATFLRDRFVVTLGDVSNLARLAFDRIFDTARLEGQTQALRIQLAQQGESFDAFIAKLDEVAQGTIATGDLIKASSSALLLGIPADKIAKLLEVARASAIATGRSTADAFNDIATGIGRASPMILDNLGLVVKLGPAYEEAARALGKSTEELTAAEQKTALLNEVLRVGEGRIKAYGDAHSTMAQGIEQGQAALENFRTGVSRVVSLLGVGLAQVITGATQGFVLLAKAALAARDALAGAFPALVGFTKSSDEAHAAVDRVAASLERMQTGLQAIATQQWAELFGTGADAAQRAANATAAAANAAAVAAESFNVAGQGAQVLKIGFQGAAEKADGLNVELAENATTAKRATNENRVLAVAIREVGNAVIFTYRQFDELARAQGRAAATQAALAGGGRTILGGTRVLLPGGGSRLTSEPGLNGGRFV